MSARRLATAVACLVLPGLSAQASFIGHDVRASTYYPEIGDLIGLPETATVGAGLEFHFFPSGNPLLDADFGATTIDIAFTTDSGVSPANFAGVVFDDVSGTIPEIIGVSLLSTSDPQFDASRIAFGSDEIALNFQGLADVSHDTLALSVTFVPEPSTAALLAAGLAAVGFHARRGGRVTHGRR